MTSIDHNKVLLALREVRDIKTGKDIIAAKLVEDFKVDDTNISFSIVLNANDAALKSSLNIESQTAITKLYPNASIHIHFKIKSDTSDIADKIMPQVKNIIAVASGKGGVGKSTISVNLTIGLANLGFKVGLIDADLYGPSIPTMMGLVGTRPKIDLIHNKHKIIPLQAFGVHVISVGFIVEPDQAVVLRGPRLGGLIKQFIFDVIWPDLDYLIVDLPPGTGDVQLTLVQTVPVTAALLVTTPQQVALIDAIKAMNMFLLPNIQVPILGIVENMSWFSPTEMPNHKYHIFGHGGGKKLADAAESALLAQIPLIQSACDAGDTGFPVAADKEHSLYPYFLDLAQKVNAQTIIRNTKLQPTQKVSINTK